MNISDLHVVEWSVEQRVFHVTTVDQMLSENREIFLSEREPDPSETEWIVLAVESSYDAAHAKMNELKALLDKPSK